MITLEPYQGPAVDWLTKQKIAFIESPAGSGKTIIAAAALDRVVRAKPRTRKVNIGWIANTTEQVGQAWDALNLFKAMLPLVDLRVCCAQAEPDMTDRDVLIVDEAHHGPSEQWLKTIQPVKELGKAVWMFSATPWNEGDEEREAAMRALCNNNFFTIERSEVGKRLTAARVIMLNDTDTTYDVLDPDYDSGFKAEPLDQVIEEEIEACVEKTLKKANWPIVSRLKVEYSSNNRAGLEKFVQENKGSLKVDVKSTPFLKLFDIAIDIELAKARRQIYINTAFRIAMCIGIVPNHARNQAIIRAAKAHPKDSVLILVHSVEHGKALAEQIPGSMAVYSKLGAKKRKQAVEDFKAGVLKCMVATSLADEGLDCPRANVLILACAGRSSTKIVQRTGRVLRKFENKSEGIIYDFVDPQHRVLKNQSIKRVEMYRRLGYLIGNEML